MPFRAFLSLAVVFISTYILEGQTIVERLGGIPTHYEIVSGTNNLDVENQYLYQKVIPRTVENGVVNVKKLVFCFVSEENELDHYYSSNSSNKKKYVLKLYDDKNELFAEYFDIEVKVKTLGEGSEKYFYEIEVNSLPIYIWDVTRKIDIYRWVKI